MLESDDVGDGVRSVGAACATCAVCGVVASPYAGAATPAEIDAAAMPTAKVLRTFMGKHSFLEDSCSQNKSKTSQKPAMGKQVS
ncbi:hypothetical protein HMPREF2678_01130 [Corynebacterium sp. HMSC058E07]|nr:hypothetical protein HMPREF2678_01130 [Corynebacterium sp. HMSC058E07]